MKLQETMQISSIYTEVEFSAALADNLDALGIGSFEDAKTESNVNKRRADIVAVGEDGILVVENQFGKADWDHWGRLEAYTRAQNANAAALVAESFEDLMIVTCNRRNEESNIDWYLIQVQVNVHKEFSFHHVSRPAIDIQIGPEPDIEYSEFWAPIRDGGLGECFAGKPILAKYDYYIAKTIPSRKIQVYLFLTKQRCYVRLYFLVPMHLRRDEVMELFPESDYDYTYKDTNRYKTVIFPVLDKGKNDRGDWNEIREKLVAMGTDIYNKINESDL